MLRAYVDDSISSVGERRLVLATLIQTDATWSAFELDWRHALAAPPAIAYLKMAEAQNRRDQFKGFSEKERNRKLHALADVVARHALWGFHASVSTRDYRELVEPVAPYPMRTPYFLLFYAIVFGVARMHEALAVDEPCDFVFDNYSGLDKKTLPMLNDMIATSGGSWGDRISGSVKFADDKDEVAIQAADMLAWLIRRQGDGPLPPGYDGLLDKLVVYGVNRFIEVDRATLERDAAGLAAIPGVDWIDKQGWREMIPIWEGGHAKALNDAVTAAGLYPPKDWKPADRPPSC
ncbi:DUF3800 domain-containing protein [Sphingomonas sp. HITSZ_GF]|uniref:DUF3800 domain-containing protein n=1 Tax=Sphingomonas sp. HITSZ_GF TaxID=3037247 RepID=UPI00240E829B|nr:DUF3800 domain-containing protein [Sphingomonas sp. HITSZ_GF]MDG2532570.1 DUF3800 domain-containing protein [Sphingomonas sp. HITSZ_GF]